jgi:hypothetical protein
MPNRVIFMTSLQPLVMVPIGAGEARGETGDLPAAS